MATRFKSPNLLIEDKSSARVALQLPAARESADSIIRGYERQEITNVIEKDFVNRTQITFIVPDPNSSVAAVSILKRETLEGAPEIMLYFCPRNMNGFSGTDKAHAFWKDEQITPLFNSPERQLLETYFKRIKSQTYHPVKLHMDGIKTEPAADMIAHIKNSKILSADTNLNNFLVSIIEQSVNGENLSPQELQTNLNRYETALNKPNSGHRK